MGVPIPIIQGIYTNQSGDYRTALPRNLVPVVTETGISGAYLRPAEGIVQNSSASGPGLDRGGINWNNICHRVMGNSLVRVEVDGSITDVDSSATIAGTDRARFARTPDFLAVCAGKKLYYYNGNYSHPNSITEITDANLGDSLDVVWANDFVFSIDGLNIIASDITDPTVFPALQTDQAEVDPDGINSLIKIRNEIYAVGRYTIQLYAFSEFATPFPLEDIESATIDKGSLGRDCAVKFLDRVAFLGSGNSHTSGEAPAVWLGLNSEVTKISSREVDLILKEYTEVQLSTAVMETKVDNDHQHLWLRLPDRTLVHDATASVKLGFPVWFVLTTGTIWGTTFAQYRAQNLVWCYDKWLVGDAASLNTGRLDDTIGSQFGDLASWEFVTPILYNKSNGVIVHELELVSLPGRQALGDEPRIFTEWSIDGERWSQRKEPEAGVITNSTKRINWLSQGHFLNYRMQRFSGLSDARLSVGTIDARFEELVY